MYMFNSMSKQQKFPAITAGYINFKFGMEIAFRSFTKFEKFLFQQPQKIGKKKK